MKGKNILWGTALYLTGVLALYNRKKVALDEAEAKTSDRDPGTWRAEQISAAKAAGTKLEQKFETAYLAKKWAR